MSTKLIRMFMVFFCIVCLIGCEGAEGPAGPAGPAGDPGPNIILAYGDIDIGTELPHNVISSGPEGVTISVETVELGVYKVTVDGTFPTTQGTLFVSSSSAMGVTDSAVCGSIVSWSTTRIVFDLRMYYISDGEPDWDDFSFVIIG